MDPVADETPKESPDEFTARAHRLHRRRTRWLVTTLLGGAAVLLLLCGGGLWYGIHRVGVARQETQFQSQLMRMGLAAHNFHGEQRRFPPLAVDKRETPDFTVPLSFQTALLPHLGHGPVFESIDKTLAWDDPSNLFGYGLALPAFLSPKYEIEKTATGHGAAFIVPNERMMPDGVGLKMTRITDGTSNTIMAGGIDETSVPAWGDPKNGRDPAKGFGGGAQAFGGHSGGGAQVLMADGSARALSAEIDPAVAKALATPAGGEVVEQGDY